MDRLAQATCGGCTTATWCRAAKACLAENTPTDDLDVAARLRSALPPAPGGGEAPVAWAVRSADGQVWAVMHGHYAEREAESWRETWACTHTLRAPYTVAPLYAHPTHAPVGEPEREAVTKAVAAVLESAWPVGLRWRKVLPEIVDAALAAHRAARTA